mmetsp:Transcript_49365/g.91350  ORF Transcript_49365/g.91350 Transcript_49365/m.91350 type:complete len:466 (-) Transcript_49365:279-1676(-)
MIQALCVFLVLLGAEAQAFSDMSECSKTESCEDSSVFLQSKVSKSGAMDVDEVQPGCGGIDEDGYPISEEARDGYRYICNASIASAEAHEYHHVANEDACNAICIKNASCLGFIFDHQPEEDGNYKCYLATSRGQGTFYHPCCHVGIPWDRTTTTTSTTVAKGTFTLKYTERRANKNSTAWVYTDWCAAEIDHAIVVVKCKPPRPEMFWIRESEGYYVNSVSGKCMGFGKTRPQSYNAMDGLLVPLDVKESTADEQCAYLTSSKLRIGKDLLSPHTKTCYQATMPDNLAWWFRCTVTQVIDFANGGADGPRYLTAYNGTLKSWTETGASALRREAPALSQETGAFALETEAPALLQDTQLAKVTGEAEFPNCRKFAVTTCPTIEQVKEVPATNGERQICWDAWDTARGVKIPWWTKCRCNLAGRGCGGSVPCLVKILEIVPMSCLKYTVIANTSNDATIGESSAP